MTTESKKAASEKPVVINLWWSNHMRVETPSNMTLHMWEQLRKYVEVIKPDEAALDASITHAKEKGAM